MARMAKKIPREDWIEEIPFDVAEWGDKEGRYEGNRPLFQSEAEFTQASERAREFAEPPAQ